MRMIFLSLFLFLLFFLSIQCEEIPTYRVVIDPGHGGAPTNFKDDKWDPITKKYLDNYNIGMKYKNYYEYKIVLQIGKKIFHYLNFTQNEKDWKKFEDILKMFSPQKEFKKIKIQPFMSRTINWEDTGLKETNPLVNDPFRLYDFPKNGKIIPGRISRINAFKPHLVVSLHLNPGGPGHSGGMSAVLAPGFKTFYLIKEIFLRKKDKKEFEDLPWSSYWLVNEPNWTKLEMAFSDTWVYFHGFRWNKKTNKPWLEKNRGIRYNMVQWIYRDDENWVEKAKDQMEKNLKGQYTLDYQNFIPEGKFWEREQSELEYWRREAPFKEYGILFGGDNHFASDELLRFIQYGVRIQTKNKKNIKIGPILDPFVSTYGLPTLINAICAYLELAHLDVLQDREFILKYQEEISKSIAVGIYSLFVGLELKKEYNSVFKPRGKNVDFNKYIEHKDGNYFEKVVNY